MPAGNSVAIARPYNCDYCEHGYYAFWRLSELASSLGLTYRDLEGSMANRQDVLNAITAIDPVMFTGTGHGWDDVYTGEGGADVFWSGDCSSLKDRIVYLMSCRTGRGLGPSIINVGGIAYAGYDEDWWWTFEPDVWHPDPFDDMYAHGFWESGIAMPKIVFQGSDWSTAYMDSLDVYDSWIDYWINSEDPGAGDALRYLVWDRDSFIAIGNGEANISEGGEWTGPVPISASSSLGLLALIGIGVGAYLWLR